MHEHKPHIRPRAYIHLSVLLWTRKCTACQPVKDNRGQFLCGCISQSLCLPYHVNAVLNGEAQRSTVARILGKPTPGWGRPRFQCSAVARVSELSLTLYNFYINNIPKELMLICLFADTCLYATERKEGYVLRKLKSKLSSITVWCMRWNIIIYKYNTRALYFYHIIRLRKCLLTSNGWNIHLVNSIK
jgi:hypothetical protein